MAQRDLTVRVRADVGAYQRAMSGAVKSTDQLARAGLGLQRKGMQISQLGDTLTKRVTLPLALAGAAAIKMATDFDNSFTKMQTLAGVSAGEVDGLKESVLDLAGETGKAPRELAEALYFLQSSGLDGAAAMDALEMSAKASAAGLGDTAVVADAVSSAMLAYAKSGLTAAEATDVLVETARQGKVEPAELAGQMGRLVPIASELGIKFGDVGGAIAALSTKGNNAEQATTQLTNVMMKLLKPSQQATKLLEEVGLSTDTIRASIKEKGLLATLEELRAKLGEAGFVKFLEDTQAVQGGLALLGGDLDKTKEIFGAVGDAAGATDNAFSTWAKSMGAQNARAFANFQVALIKIGDTLAPIASDVLNFVSMIAEAFSNLPGPVQTAILAFAGLAAAAGPVLSISGRLITGFGTLLRMMDSLAVPSGAVAGAFNKSTAAASGFSAVLGAAGIAGALAAVSTGMALFLRSANEARIAAAAEAFANLEDVTRENVAAIGLLNDAVKVSTTDFTASASAAQTFAESGRLTAQSLKDLDDGFHDVLQNAPGLAEAFIDNAAAAGVPVETLREWRGELADKIDADAEATTSQDNYNAAVEEAAGITEEASSALQEYSDTLKAMTDPLFAAMNAITGTRDAQLAYKDAVAGVKTAQEELDTAIAEHGATSDEAREATRKLEDAERARADAEWATVESAAEADSALAGLKDAVNAGDVSVSMFKDTLAQWVAQGFLTQQQADDAARSVGGLADQANEADKERVDIPVTTPGSKTAQDQLHRTTNEALKVPTRRNTNVTTSGTNQAKINIQQVKDKISSLNDKTVHVNVAVSGMAQLNIAQNKLLGFQHGGRVPGPVGSDQIILAHGGETVLPTHDKAAMARFMPSPLAFGGGGATYVDNRQITVYTGADPQQVVDALRKYERRNGSVPIRVSG